MYSSISYNVSKHQNIYTYSIDFKTPPSHKCDVTFACHMFNSFKSPTLQGWTQQTHHPGSEKNASPWENPDAFAKGKMMFFSNHLITFQVQLWKSLGHCVSFCGQVSLFPAKIKVLSLAVRSALVLFLGNFHEAKNCHGHVVGKLHFRSLGVTFRAINGRL